MYVGMLDLLISSGRSAFSFAVYLCIYLFLKLQRTRTLAIQNFTFGKQRETSHVCNAFCDNSFTLAAHATLYPERFSSIRVGTYLLYRTNSRASVVLRTKAIFSLKIFDINILAFKEFNTVVINSKIENIISTECVNKTTFLFKINTTLRFSGGKKINYYHYNLNIVNFTP